MIQAVDGFSSREPMPSTGQNAENSRRRSTGKIDRLSSRPVTGTTGTFYLNEGGREHGAEIIRDLAADDADRLDTIMGRAGDLKRLLGILVFSPDMNEDAVSVLGVIMREIDAIYAIAIQPSLSVEYVS